MVVIAVAGTKKREEIRQVSFKLADIHEINVPGCQKHANNDDSAKRCDERSC